MLKDSFTNTLQPKVQPIVAYDFLDDQTLASIAREILARSGNDPQLRVAQHSAAMPIITSGVCNACGTQQSNPNAKVCESCGMSYMMTLYIGY